MFTTSEILIERLRLAGDDEAWRRFVDLYLPLIYRWNCEAGLQPADAADVAQEIFLWVSQNLNEFERQHVGAFRSWLKTIAFYKIQSHRKHKVMRSLETADENQIFEEDPLLKKWGDDHDQALLDRALELIRPEFTPKTFDVFIAVFINQENPTDVANRFGLNRQNVYVSRSRVLSRLRVVLKGYMEQEIF